MAIKIFLSHKENINIQLLILIQKFNYLGVFLFIYSWGRGLVIPSLFQRFIFIERVQPDVQAIHGLSFQVPFEVRNYAQLRGSRIDTVLQHNAHSLQPPPGKHYRHFGAKCTE